MLKGIKLQDFFFFLTFSKITVFNDFQCFPPFHIFYCFFIHQQSITTTDTKYKAQKTLIILNTKALSRSKIHKWKPRSTNESLWPNFFFFLYFFSLSLSLSLSLYIYIYIWVGFKLHRWITLSSYILYTCKISRQSNINSHIINQLFKFKCL